MSGLGLGGIFRILLAGDPLNQTPACARPFWASMRESLLRVHVPIYVAIVL